MSREIRLNAFAMNCIGHQSPGLWRHPRDQSSRYTDLRTWTTLARTLEDGLFDGIFLADVLGVYDVFGGSPDAALRHGTQIPLGDPMALVPAMAAVTEHLGFGVTSSLSYEPPFLFARRMSTLDHLTSGRIGWNIVTGYLDSAARAAGRERQAAHDDRYAVAEEYMALVYRLWEASWEDGAVLRDAASGAFTDPARVHRIRHEGPHFALDAIHLCEPSPQRTPVLYQAGSSSAGRAFAARHAECVFISGPSLQVIAPRVADLREAAVAAGRRREDQVIFTMATIITGETEVAAQRLAEEYRAYVSPEGALTLMSGWTGVDLSKLKLDQAIRHVETDAGRTALDNITRADPNRVWTVRDVAEHVGIGGIGPVFVGDPAQVADQLELWADKTGVDGFNLCSVVLPETFGDTARLIVPELQRRGRFKRGYETGSLREKLFPGRGARLTPPHQAALARARDLPREERRRA